MRGKAAYLAVGRLKIRITPAYAGKSTIQKHLKSVNLGSPPPMRGKVPPFIDFAVAPRITPAYAGKRTTCTLTLSLPQDHPRLCGEKLGITANAYNDRGSPPPMRGKVSFS